MRQLWQRMIGFPKVSDTAPAQERKRVMSSRRKSRCHRGRVSYDTGGDPLRVTVSYCRFCQRATGSDCMIAPSVAAHHSRFLAPVPLSRTYATENDGSLLEPIDAGFAPRVGDWRN